MAFGGGCGLFLDLGNIDREDIERDDELLFSESLGRLLVEEGVVPADEISMQSIRVVFEDDPALAASVGTASCSSLKKI